MCEKRIALNALLIALLVFSAEAAKKGEGAGKEHFASKQVLARINGEELTYEQYDDMTRMVEFRYDVLSAHRVLEIKKDFFTHLVERRLLVQEAGRRGISVTPEEMTGRLRANRSGHDEVKLKSLLEDIGLDYDRYCRLVYEDVMIEKLLAECLPLRTKFREEELDDYYFRHLADFARRDRVRALHIFTASKRDAKVILASLKHGADFSELARHKSLGREAARGGDLGFFERSEMPLFFFDNCWRLEAGEMSGVVRSKHGYHIFKLVDKVQGRMLTQDEVRSELIAALGLEKREAHYGRFMRRLSGKAKIEMSKEVKFLSDLR